MIADHTKQQMTVFPEYDYDQALTPSAKYSPPLTPIVSETQTPRNASHDNNVSGEPRNVSPSPSRANSLPVRDTPILRRSRRIRKHKFNCQLSCRK